jgi:hypothetical protein
MNTPEPMPNPPRRRWRVVLGRAFFFFFLIFLLLWFGFPPRVPKKPVHLVRDDNGQMVPADPNDQPSGGALEMQAGAIAANNGLSSTSSTTSHGGAGLACGRVLILNRSNQLLMARVGQLLLEELKPVDLIRQVDYYPADFLPEPGQLAPDVVITLDLEALKETGLPIRNSVEARIRVTAGNGPPNCSYGYNDNLTPPGIRFDWNGVLDHKSTTTGIASSAAAYKLVAENIAKQIADSLTKEFKSHREKYGTMPELPQPFYPPFRDAPPLPLDEFGKPQILTSWHGLMNHNETFWNLTTDQPAKEVLDKIEQRMKETGWKNSLSHEMGERSYLHLTKNAASLLIYVPSKPLMIAPGSSQDASPKTTVLSIQYIDRMTETELRAAIGESLAQHASLDALLCFESLLTDVQCQGVLKMIEPRPVRTPQAALMLCNLYRRLKQDDKARRELIHAVVLLRTIPQSSDLETKARDRAKELGDEKLVEKPLEPEMLKEFGFIELKPGVQAPPQEIGFEEPVHCFANKSNGFLATISLRAVKTTSKNEENSFQLAHVESIEHGRSWGSGGTSHTFFVDDNRRVSFNLTPLAPGRFRLNIQVPVQ